MTRIGFIGLGRMGRPMASNLCRKGFHLTVYDINEAAIHELEKLQARGARNVAEVAGERVIWLWRSHIAPKNLVSLARLARPCARS
jgi:6-phosphogluconate dehydrogenase (decarboxylating)